MQHTNTLLSNQYHVRPTTELRRTDYPSDRPHVLAERWREQGWSAVEHQGRVRVFHGAEAPLPLDQAETSELLPLTPNEATVKALGGALGRALVRNGYQPREGRKYTLFRDEGRPSPTGIKGLKVYRFRTWTWDLDFQGEDCWLTLRPTWTRVTEMPAVRFAARFMARYPAGRYWTMVNLRSGRIWAGQALSDFQDADWAREAFVGVVYAPRTEGDDVSPDVPDIHEAARAEPAFAAIAEMEQPRALDARECWAINGQHLKIRKTPVAERREVNRLGIHRKPLLPVTLAFVLPSRDAAARQALTYRFGDPSAVKGAGLSLPATSVPYVWNTKWKLRGELALTWASSPLGYNPATGELNTPHLLQRLAEQAHEEGKTLVTVTVLPAERMAQDAMATLLVAVRPFNHVLFGKEAHVPEDGTEKPEACWSRVSP